MIPAVPEYVPPNARRAALAVGIAPIVSLAAFTGIVAGLVEPEIGVAVFAACALWVASEMMRYLEAVDSSDAEFASRHLAWRPPATLREMVRGDELPPATHDAVKLFLDAELGTARD